MANVWERFEASDGKLVSPCEPPRGMLQYATDSQRFYVTVRRYADVAPSRVTAAYSADRSVYVEGIGKVRVEALTGHYKP